MYARSHVIQSFLDLFDQPAYLEIGVNEGHTFHAVRAARKIAVDPNFLFRPESLDIPAGMAQYHEVTSDEYFSQIATPGDKFDVIFLDGLHVFEQTLRDLLNAIFFLKPTGVILLDDAVPVSYAASLPSMEKWIAVRTAFDARNPTLPPDGSWMGDVYKVVFFLQAFLPQLSFATVSENHGQTVAWRQARPVPAVPECQMGAFAQLDYSAVVTRLAEFRPMPLSDIVALVQANLPRLA